MYLPIKTTANHNKVLFALIFFIFVNTKLLTSYVNASALYLNPATGSILTTSFDITASLDTQTQPSLKTVDIYITFDPTLVSVSRVDKIALAQTATATYDNTYGQIHIKGDLLQTPSPNTIVNFARIYFNTKANSKGKTAQFTIDRGTGKSSLLDTTATENLTQVTGANLLIDANSTMVNNSTGTNIPKTGSDFTIYALVILFLTTVSSLYLRNVASKF